MDDATRSSPISFAGGLTAGDEGFPAVDQGSQIGSAAGSLQGEVILSGGGEGGSGSDADFGFQRPELGKLALVGTVQFYERHVFLCYKTPHVWPSHVEAAEFDRLPRLLSAALAARKGEMKKREKRMLWLFRFHNKVFGNSGKRIYASSVWLVFSYGYIRLSTLKPKCVLVLDRPNRSKLDWSAKGAVWDRGSGSGGGARETQKHGGHPWLLTYQRGEKNG